MRRERDIQAETILLLQEAFPDGVFYRRNVGAVKVKDRFIRFGVRGQADIGGCVDGRLVEVEVKRPGEKQSLDQKHWQQAIEHSKGIYVLAYDPQQAVDELKRKLQWHEI